MYLARVSANGQITIPIEIRRALGLNAGSKALFTQNEAGDYVIRNSSTLLQGKEPFHYVSGDSTVKAGKVAEPSDSIYSMHHH